MLQLKLPVLRLQMARESAADGMCYSIYIGNVLIKQLRYYMYRWIEFVY